MKHWTLVVLLLGLQVVPEDTGNQANDGTTETKVCLYNSSCILPSRDRYGTTTIIHWDYMTGGDVSVHSFYHNKDQLQLQDPRFQGRTSLVEDPITGTKTALKLKDVKVQDEGEYKCFLSSGYHGDQLSYVVLQVYAPVQRVNLVRAGNSAPCSSEGVYPQPELTWSTQPPSNGSAPSPSLVQQKETKLYNISSSLKLSDRDGDLLLSCTVSTALHKGTSTWRELITNGTRARISCSHTNTSLKSSSLVWRFNHTDVIMEWSSTDGQQVSAEWEEHVVREEEPDVLHLQDLSSDQEGTYSCERSSAEETTAAHTLLRVNYEPSLNLGLVVGLPVTVLLLVLLSVVICFVCRRRNKGNICRSADKRPAEPHEMDPMNPDGSNEP